MAANCVPLKSQQRFTNQNVTTSNGTCFPVIDLLMYHTYTDVTLPIPDEMPTSQFTDEEINALKRMKHDWLMKLPTLGFEWTYDKSSLVKNARLDLARRKMFELLVLIDNDYANDETYADMRSQLLVEGNNLLKNRYIWTILKSGLLETDSEIYKQAIAYLQKQNFTLQGGASAPTKVKYNKRWYKVRTGERGGRFILVDGGSRKVYVK